jgi:hypothetical protein
MPHAQVLPTDGSHQVVIRLIRWRLANILNPPFIHPIAVHCTISGQPLGSSGEYYYLLSRIIPPVQHDADDGGS